MMHLEATVQIRPMTMEDIQGFWECVSEVAKERKYLSFVGAPPIGFKHEGCRRKAKKLDGVHEDILIMALLREELNG